jgi:TRAP-type C4-dicarboxylate transport system substrate-binding protein
LGPANLEAILVKRLLTLALLLFPVANGRAEDVTIKLGTLAPSGSAWHEALKDMAQRWQDASGGQVKLRIYPGGAQGSEGDMIRKLGIGQLQAVAVSNVGLHDVVPEPQTFSAPLLFENETEMECAFGRVKGQLEDSLRKRGLVALQWSRVGMASFFCNAPFKTPAEMARAKMFAWEGDPATVKAWRAAGFHPVVLSSTDLVPGLTTGMVDCVGNVPLYMLTSRAFEKARYLIDLPLGAVLGATVVRKDTWDQIAPDVQARLLEISREIGTRIDAEVRRLNADAVDAMKKQGLEVVSVEPEAWRPTLEKGWSVFRGEVVPAKFFDEVQASRDACRADGASARRKPN